VVEEHVKQTNEIRSVPSEREFAANLIMVAAIMLVIATVIAVAATWVTTRHYEPHIHQKALRTATILPLIIVPLCTSIVGYQSILNHRRMLRVFQLAHTDEMTNLANRRAFMQEARHRFETVDLEFYGLSIFIIDLDHFKKVNDAYGHEAGDEVLIHASRQIVEALPEDAMVARLGGEEFAVLLPYADITQIYHYAEAIRHRVASKPCAYLAHRIQVSASVGVGIAHARDTVRSVMTRADDALYDAKDEGRNRFVIAA
jgi:diguanylate cyclase (GGDEF)-like protein